MVFPGLPTVRCEEPPSSSNPSLATSALDTVRTTVAAVPETELKRWRRTFDSHAKVDVKGEKCVNWTRPHDCSHQSHRFLDPESFVNSIAPTEDASKISRSQFSILFRVADANKRGLVSWEDFVVFETGLKRPDADYWMAFQYFDSCVASLAPCLHLN